MCYLIIQGKNGLQLKKANVLFKKENKNGKLDLKKESKELFFIKFVFGLCNVWMLLCMVVHLQDFNPQVTIGVVHSVLFTIKFLVCSCVKIMISASFWYRVQYGINFTSSDFLYKYFPKLQVRKIFIKILTRLGLCLCLIKFRLNILRWKLDRNPSQIEKFDRMNS